MMKFKVQDSGGVPVGIYSNAVFDGIEPVPENKEKGYKAGWRFNFAVTEGEHAGAKASRILGGDRPTTRNGLGRMLSELTGQPLADGVEYDLAPCVGRKYTIVVRQGEGGGTRVDTVMAAK